MSITLNKQQQNIKDSAVDWFFNRTDKQQVFQYSGGPGTGKTTLLKEIISAFDLLPEEIAPMSFIGAAAMNMRNNGLYNAKTIHSWLFEAIEEYKLDNKGNIVYDQYYNRPIMVTRFIPRSYGQIKSMGIRLFIIDEGSCVPYRFKSIIENYGIPILVTGDIDQLPPVSDRSAYLDNPNEVMQLTEIMRQAKDSSIIQIAQMCKYGEPIHNGYYGDVLVINEDELTNNMIARSNIIICGKNHTKDMYNKRVRHEILGINTPMPCQGERLICRKNDWKREVDGISLANGLIGTIINSPDISEFVNGKGFYIDFHPDIMPPNIYFDRVLVDYSYLKSESQEQRNTIKNNKYDTGDMNYFEYGYAITAHLAQGSQFNNVIYIEDYLNEDINRKLNYVGATRAKQNLIYVKHNKRSYNR